MVDGLALWKQLLQVQEPWVVQACRADEFNRCMAVWIGVEAPRSWFGLGRPRVAEGGTEATWRLSLRAINLADTAYADRADYAFGNYRYFPGRGRAAFVEVAYRHDR